MDDAFHSEEFYKMIALLLLRKRYGRCNEPMGIVCCRRYAYYIQIHPPAINIMIGKFDLDLVDRMFSLFFEISKYFNRGRCEREFQVAMKKISQKENPSIINQKNVKGIEKNKALLPKRRIIRLPLQNIANNIFQK